MYLDIFRLLSELGVTKLTEAQARAVCNSVQTGSLMGSEGRLLVERLVKKFPKYKWRIILIAPTRTSRALALTIDDPDPRQVPV